MKRYRAVTAGVLSAIAVLTGPARAGQEEVAEFPPLPPTGEWQAIEEVFARLPDVNREAVLQFLSEEFADEVRVFQALSVRHLSRATMLLRRVVSDALEIMDAKQNDPERYRKLMRRRAAEQSAVRLSAACKRSEGKDRERAVEALRRSLQEAFELKQEFMKSEVGRLEKEVAELKALIARRESQREAIVDRRLAGMVSGEDLEW